MSTESPVHALYRRIEAQRTVFLDLARELWQRPELGFEERHAAERQVGLLRDWGFRVEAPYGGLETAYRAEWGEGGAVFAIASEYDALPEIGHACGHNLICAAALAAAHVLRQHLEETGQAGRIVVFGTPAEEGGSGKVLLERAGCLEGIEAVMMVHPNWRNSIDPGCTALERAEIGFFGKAAHAGGSPEQGINALDAMLLLFNAVSCWRQQLPEDARVHGVITEGGKRPNIIPDHTQASFYLRSTSDADLAGMVERFKGMAEGACRMTGCTHRLEISPLGTKARRPNRAMNQRYQAAMEALGQPVQVPGKAGRGSTDFGNFSAARPGIHPYFAIAGHEIPGHSLEMAAAADSDFGRENMLRAAAAMADVGLAVLEDPAFRQEVAAAFGE